MLYDHLLVHVHHHDRSYNATLTYIYCITTRWQFSPTLNPLYTQKPLRFGVQTLALWANIPLKKKIHNSFSVWAHVELTEHVSELWNWQKRDVWFIYSKPRQEDDDHIDGSATQHATGDVTAYLNCRCTSEIRLRSTHQLHMHMYVNLDWCLKPVHGILFAF